MESEQVQHEIITFFSEHLSPKGGKDLRKALADQDAEAFWRLWAGRVRQRAELLDLEQWRERLSDSEPIPGEDKLGEEFSVFAVEAAEMALKMESVSPVLWLKMIQQVLPLWGEGEMLAPDDPLYQILFGEWKLLFGFLYPELTEMNSFPAEARRSIQEGILTLTDRTGFPSAEHFFEFRAILDSWLRGLSLAERVGFPILSASAKKRLEWILLAVLRLTRADGTPLFKKAIGYEPETKRFYRWISEAFRFDADQSDRQAAAEVWKGIAPSFLFSRQKTVVCPFAEDNESSAPDASIFTDSSSAAFFRTSWNPAEFGAAAAILPDENGKSRFLFEVDCEKKPLFSGEWKFSARWNGEPLLPDGEWMPVCEEQSEQRIYWEHTLPLTGGWRLERQILFVPGESILLTADGLIGPDDEEMEEGIIEYTSTLPGTPFYQFQQDEAGWEMEAVPYFWKKPPRNGTLKPVTRLVPLTLPEWQADSSQGIFVSDIEGLTLTMTGNGPGLYAAYCLDFDSRRLAKPYTWRHLTVGRNRTKTPGYEAAGFRYQAGDDIYLIYKSLGESLPRSVLGEHFDQEFVFARFAPDGGTELILEVESADDESL